MNDISKARPHNTNPSGRWVCGVALAALLFCGFGVSSSDRGVPLAESAKVTVENADGPTRPVSSDDSAIRARQLIFHSEDLRHIPETLEIWERAWAMEMPDLATPYRVHGHVL